MRSVIISILMVLLSSVSFGAPSESVLYVEEFDTSHDYLVDGVTGTMWDGFLYNGGYVGTQDCEVSQCAAASGVLNIASKLGNWEGAADDGLLLYKTVEGDFDAEIYISAANAVQWNDIGLMARVANSADAGDGEDWVAVRYFASQNKNARRAVDNNIQSNVDFAGAQRYIRMERIDDTFKLYRKVNAGDAWEYLTEVERPDMAGLPLQVGIQQTSYNTGNVGSCQIDYFKIAVPISAAHREQNPASADLKSAFPEWHSKTMSLVPMEKVKMTDSFWAPRIELHRTVTLPHSFEQVDHEIQRKRVGAEWIQSGGTTPKPTRGGWGLSDLVKIMEGAAYVLRTHPDPALEAKMDQIISYIAVCQQEDGYLYFDHTAGIPGVERMAGEAPYEQLIKSHEFYNIGHLYEAAAAYTRATGKTNFLEIAKKSAHHVNKVVFEGEPNYNNGKPLMQPAGHQQIEIGLIKMYNQTGDPFYLELSKKLLDIRGKTYTPPGGTVFMQPFYSQQHKPVAEQMEAVGHSVRAGYLYTAMTSVDSIYGTDNYTQALNSIWHDIVDRKMHITGGCGPVRVVEGYKNPYYLPNKDAALETCGAVANFLFNIQMFLENNDAKHIDVAEVSLLNCVFSGIGLDGRSYFYHNPLEVDWGHEGRAPWKKCACCPSNYARLIPALPGYMYALGKEGIYTVFYGGSDSSVKFRGQSIQLKQNTKYPYDGRINLEVNPEETATFSLFLRIPTWAGKQFVPGELYNYTESSPKWTLTVNGKEQGSEVIKGFIEVKRQWEKGDTVVLDLPMPFKANTCIEAVEYNRDRVAFTRGPLVYCAEGVDNEGAVQRFFVDPAIATENAQVLVNDDPILKSKPLVIIDAKQKTNQGVLDGKLKMIPYYAWSNRDLSSMMVWYGTNSDLAQLDMRDSKDTKYASVEASYSYDVPGLNGMNMHVSPSSSHDNSIPRWTSWKRKGEPQWFQITLKKIADIKSVSIYWYDDNRGVQVPAEWHIEVQNEDKWERLLLYLTDTYSTLKDSYNTVSPQDELITDTFRIVMEPKPDACMGILSINVITE